MARTNATAVIIFGASGDLTKRKMIPALYQLHKDGLIPGELCIIGFARKEKSPGQFRTEMAEALRQFSRSKPQTGDKNLTAFLKCLHYQTGNYDHDDSYVKLEELISKMFKKKTDQINRLYYLSIPPSVFLNTITMLGLTGHLLNVSETNHWTRVIIEKPFGRDLESARSLSSGILSIVDESQIYRIDHYLGKETVQNIMAFRFGNSIFEPLWNRRYVDHIQITVSEDVSVEGRGGYYDHAGALRDMVQNHILQLAALVAMEPPASFAPNAVRNEKVKVLSALRPLSGDQAKRYTVRGQYVAGAVNSRQLVDYLSESGVATNSKTETFVAIKFFIDNWRWADVPFYVRTGKAMNKRLSEIVIEFRQPPLALFGHSSSADDFERSPNSLVLRVQPNEGIRLNFGLKIPGPSMTLQATDMEFCYGDVFQAEPPEAYERLILDAVLGDSTLFIRRDEVESAWQFIDSIQEGWSRTGEPHIYPYRAGGWGPYAADEFIALDGRKWVNE